MMQLFQSGGAIAAFQVKGNPIFLVLGIGALVVGFLWIQRDKKKRQEEKERLKETGEHNPKGTGGMFDENPKDTRIKKDNLRKPFIPKAVKEMQEEEAERERQAKHIYTPEEIEKMIQEDEEKPLQSEEENEKEE